MITARRGVVLRQEADGEDGDVVLRVGQEQALEHPVAHLGQRQVRELGQGVEHLLGAGVDVAVPPLDQPVGVEQDGVADRQRGDVVLAHELRRDAEQQVGRLPVEQLHPPGALMWTGGGWPALAQRR